jgi:hypothetical protein
MSATDSDEHLMWRYRLGTTVEHDTIGCNTPRILTVTAS